MWLYIFTAALCVFLWKFLRWLMSYVHRYRATAKALSKFPLLEEHHWFYGISHAISDWDGFFKILQRNVDKTSPKAVAVWISAFQPSIVAVHPDPVKDILKASHTIAMKSDEYKFFKPWIGEGLLLSNGTKWERNRRLMSPAFHFDVLKPYVAIYNDVVELLLNNISKLQTDGESLNVCPMISRATLDTVLRCALSYVDEGVQSTDSAHHPYCEAVNQLKDMVLRRWLNPLHHSDFIFSLTSESKKMKKLCDYVHDFSDKIIKQRREALANDPTQLEKRHLDFLDILLTARDDNGKGLSDEEIRAEVDTFMFGGHDTTASAIMWALHSLAKYPKMQQLVSNEVKSVLAGRTALEFDDISKLEYTTRFIKESIRMYPPAPAHDRRLSKPITIDGVTFPAKTLVAVSAWSVHHNPSVWEDHNEFDPDRFLPERIAKKDAFAFVPFSAGQRNCIGQHFALNEIKVLVSRLVARFEISLDINREAVPYRDVITSAKDGIFLHFRDL